MKQVLAYAIIVAAVCATSTRPGRQLPDAEFPAHSESSIRLAGLQEEKSSCKLEFVGPGEKCGSYGTCPETAHRSFLWGLIEYDTDIVLCWCLTECDVSL